MAQNGCFSNGNSHPVIRNSIFFRMETPRLFKADVNLLIAEI